LLILKAAPNAAAELFFWLSFYVNGRFYRIAHPCRLQENPGNMYKSEAAFETILEHRRLSESREVKAVLEMVFRISMRLIEACRNCYFLQKRQPKKLKQKEGFDL
jgi:hypothetical protein